jgi:hypothetical protein
MVTGRSAAAIKDALSCAVADGTLLITQEKVSRAKGQTDVYRPAPVSDETNDDVEAEESNGSVFGTFYPERDAS